MSRHAKVGTRSLDDEKQNGSLIGRIPNRVASSRVAHLSELEGLEFPANPKWLTESGKKRLIASIRKNGFSAPIFIGDRKSVV